MGFTELEITREIKVKGVGSTRVYKHFYISDFLGQVSVLRVAKF